MDFWWSLSHSEPGTWWCRSSQKDFDHGSSTRDLSRQNVSIRPSCTQICYSKQWPKRTERPWPGWCLTDKPNHPFQNIGWRQKEHLWLKLHCKNTQRYRYWKEVTFSKDNNSIQFTRDHMIHDPWAACMLCDGTWAVVDIISIVAVFCSLCELGSWVLRKFPVPRLLQQGVGFCALLCSCSYMVQCL